MTMMRSTELDARYSIPVKKLEDWNRVSSPKKVIELHRSLFKSELLFHSAETFLKDVLRKALLNKETSLPWEDALDRVAQQDSHLADLDFEHLVELYLRHNPGFFRIEGNTLIPTSTIHAGLTGTPPEVLYFGTNLSTATSILNHGLLGHRSPKVTVTSDRGIACSRAQHFARTNDSTPCLVTIQAKEAHEKGTTFWIGERPGLYLAEYIDKAFVSMEELVPDSVEDTGSIPPRKFSR